MTSSRRELLDDFLHFVTEHGDDVARAIAGRALNRALLTIWLKRDWAQFRSQSPYTFSTVAGTRDYALPRHFGRMADRDGRIRNLTVPSDIDPIDRGALDRGAPEAGTAFETAGRPRGYLLDNTVGVSAQPSSAGEACEVLSDAAGDVDVRIYIEGYSATGIYQRSETTLTGSVAVTVGIWSQIERFGKSYPDGTDAATDQTTSRGTVTLRTTADSTVLQTLLPDEAALDLPVLTLYPKPDQVYTIAVPFTRKPLTLRHDSDPVPTNWELALFEELRISWLINKGKLALDGPNIPRPHLADLIALENVNRVPLTKHRRPYGG